MDSKNETTYFFTNFPTNFSEYDMWKNFQRRGRLKEGFIPRKLDWKGYRFGFVRFQDVKNVGELEQDLNKIRIGKAKLHNNIARFKKDE